MADFTTQITDQGVIAELPDISILANLYSEGGHTAEELGTMMGSVSFRKKLQSLLEFKLSAESRDTLYISLRDAYIAHVQDNWVSEEELVINIDGDKVFVNNKLTTFNVDGFADGIFENTVFQAIFYTKPVMDAIFTSSDESFITALVDVPNFWDKMFDSENTIIVGEASVGVWQYLKDTYLNDVIMGYVKTREVPYVKYVAYESELTASKYESAVSLAEDSEAMDTIYLIESVRTVESNSVFGVKSRLMYVFGTTDIDAAANDATLLGKIDTDPVLKGTIVDFDTVKLLPAGSLLRNYVVNNDGNFGAIISEALGMETAINATNLFFDETFASELSDFVENEELVALLLESDLYPTFSAKFYEAFSTINVSGQDFAIKVDSANNSMVMSYANQSFTAKQVALALDGFTEAKVGVVSEVATNGDSYFVPYTFDDNSIMSANIDRSIEFTNPGNENLYNEFVGVDFNLITGSKGHFIGVNEDGFAVSSKFVLSAEIDTDAISSISVTENQAFIKTTTTIHTIGNLGADKEDIANQLVINKDAIAKVVYFNGKVLALGTGGVLNEVTNSGMGSFSPTSTLNIADIFVIDGRLVILDDAGSLKEVTSGNAIVLIAANVTMPTFAQEGIIAKISGNDRAIFYHDGSWLTYDFNVNSL